MSTRPLEQLRDRLAASLQSAGLRVASAESCSGGWIAKLCTDIAGSSDWFECGIVSYSNTSKQRLLGVPATVIEQHGAVSEPTVRAMLQGLFDNTDAGIGVAVSGIAGPGGGSPGKPVGTVWIACGLRGGRAAARCYTFAGDRRSVREQSVAAALDGLLQQLDA